MSLLAKILSATTLALVGVIVTIGVLRHDVLGVAKPPITLREANRSANIKGIAISYHTPEINSLSDPYLDLVRLNIRINFGDYGGQYFIQPRRDHTIPLIQSVQWESKTVRKGVRENISGSLEMDVIGRSVPQVNDFYLRLISEAGFRVLRNDKHKLHSKICSALQLCNQLLPICDFSLDSNAFAHFSDVGGRGFRDPLHGDSGFRRLSNRPFHFTRLIVGATSNAFGLTPEKVSRNKQEQSEEADSEIRGVHVAPKFEPPGIGLFRRVLYWIGATICMYFAFQRSEGRFDRAAMIGSAAILASLAIYDQAVGNWLGYLLWHTDMR